MVIVDEAAAPKAHSDTIHIDKSYPLPHGTDPKAVVAILNDWQNSITYLAPGADAMFATTGGDVGVSVLQRPPFFSSPKTRRGFMFEGPQARAGARESDLAAGMKNAS